MKDRGKVKVALKKVVAKYIEDGMIIMPWGENVTIGIIPLMAVNQTTKNNITLVLDFRKLNQYVTCYMNGDLIDTCKLDENGDRGLIQS